MNISNKRKILLILLSLILTVATVLFATHYLTRPSYAQVSPDSLSAYDGESGDGDDGDEESTNPGPGAVAPPIPDDTIDEPEWDTAIKQITWAIGRLEIQVDSWIEAGKSSKAKFNPNPHGTYGAETVAKIQALLNSPGFIEYEYWDIDGNVLTEERLLEITENPGISGVTIFIHVKVNDEYADNVDILYADGVPKGYPYTTDFPSSVQLTPVPAITKTKYEYLYTGETVNIKADVIDVIMQGRGDYLKFITSESDGTLQREAGVYTYVFALKDELSYYWEGTDRDRSPVTVTVTISPKKMLAPKAIEDEFYMGYEIDVFDKLVDSAGNSYGDYVIVVPGNSSKGKDAKEYTFYIMINPAYSGSIVWDDSVEIVEIDGVSTGYVAVTWSIKQATITGDWGPAGDYGRITVTSETGYVLQAGDIEYEYKDSDGNVVLSSNFVVGETYTVEAKITNPDNLKWSTDPGPHTFTLDRLPVEIPNPEIKVNVKEYNGIAYTFVITINVDNKDVPLFDSEYAEYVEIANEISDSLTQVNVGKYNVYLRLTDEAAAWEGNVTGNFPLEFEITKLVIDVTWNKSGIPTFKSNLPQGADYSKFTKTVYTNANGVEVTFSQMVKDQTYTGHVYLLDEANCEWAEGAELEFTFLYELELTYLSLITATNNVFYYTGELIKFEVDAQYQALLEEYLNSYVEIISVDGFSGIAARTYTVTLQIKENYRAQYGWQNESGYMLTLTFTILPAKVSGNWKNDGTLNLSSPTYKGNLQEVIEYTYYDADGNVLTHDQLVEGQKYTAEVKLKDSVASNFDISELVSPWEFTFSLQRHKSNFPWWIFIIIAFVIIVIIIIIIIVVKKRKKDQDNNDDYYDDEYYGDEQTGNSASSGGNGDNPDYGDYGDDFGDDYGGDYGDDFGDDLGDDYGY